MPIAPIPAGFERALLVSQDKEPAKTENVSSTPGNASLSFVAYNAGATAVALGDVNPAQCNATTLDEAQWRAVHERKKNQLISEGRYHERRPGITLTPEQEAQNKEMERIYLDPLLLRWLKAKEKWYEDCGYSKNSG